MSVGIARLRAEPDVIRRACIDKGEDPSLVDRALAVDVRRRALVAVRDRLLAERRREAREEGYRVQRIRAIDAELVALMARISAWFE